MVYSEEKSGTTPMLETTIFRSLATYNLTNQVFDFGDVLFREFQPRARRSLNVDRELSSVGAWKKCQSQKWIDRQADQEHCR